MADERMFESIRKGHYDQAKDIGMIIGKKHSVIRGRPDQPIPVFLCNESEFIVIRILKGLQ